MKLNPEVNVYDSPLKQEIDSVLSQLEYNQEAGDLYNSFLTDKYNFIDKKMIKDMESDGTDLEDAYYQCMLEVLDLPESRQLEEIERTTHFSKVTCLDVKDYQNDPYIKNIHPTIAAKGKWKITYNYYEPYEGFVFDEMKEGDNFAEITSLGFFKETFPYLEVSYSNGVYMLITPHEINTMREPIKRAKGRVLALGLGLGYYPYMVSLKEDVKEVVVVENDKSLIDLFTEKILPLMKTDKIKIVYADAFDYLEKVAPKENFDSVFFDIYHTADDGLPLYMKAKKLSALSPKSDFSYWIEEDLICMIRRYLLVMITEIIDGSTEEDYQETDEIADIIMSKLYHANEDTVIMTPEDLRKFLSADNIKAMVSRIK